MHVPRASGADATAAAPAAGFSQHVPINLSVLSPVWGKAPVQDGMAPTPPASDGAAASEGADDREASAPSGMASDGVHMAAAAEAAAAEAAAAEAAAARRPPRGRT